MKQKYSVKVSQEMIEEREQPQGLMLATNDHAAEDLSPVGADKERFEAGSDLGSDREVEREMRRHTRRSFLWATAAAAAGLSGWRWLNTRREDDGIPWPLRRALEINEQLSRDYFRSSRLAPNFPRELAQTPRVNGEIGLDDEPDLTAWRLRVLGLTKVSVATTADSSANDEADEASDSKGDDAEEKAGAPALTLTLDQIKALPRVEMVTELKCIEGWSVVTQWAGARFVDFANLYRPATRSGNPPDPRKRPEDLVRYVSLATPDDDYYVGLDMESALHPQTLLCYEMNGEPLTAPHGAPLRLVIPVKYGIKNIKGIGTIRFTDRRPPDYWAERGYDWYAGH
jgi:hypothetical protein